VYLRILAVLLCAFLFGVISSAGSAFTELPWSRVSEVPKTSLEQVYLAKGKPKLKPKFQAAAKPNAPARGKKPQAKPAAPKRSVAVRPSAGSRLATRARNTRLPTGNQLAALPRKPVVSAAAARRLNAATVKPVARALAQKPLSAGSKATAKQKLRDAKYILRSHKNTTFPNTYQAVRYHWKKHGNGKSLLQYTKDARRLWRTQRSSGSKVQLRDGSNGVKIRAPDGRFGIYSQSGKVISFGYK